MVFFLERRKKLDFVSIFYGICQTTYFDHSRQYDFLLYYTEQYSFNPRIVREQYVKNCMTATGTKFETMESTQRNQHSVFLH